MTVLTPTRQNRSTTRWARPLCAAGVACLLTLASPARGQNALGDGHALDRNLGRNTGGRNDDQAPIDFRARNLLITNDVVGGRGFRESVGYLAEDAFRGDLGSNDTFRFRADSAWSDVNYVNFGETFQRLRFGQDAGIIEYRRGGSGATMRTIDQDIYRAGDVVEARLRVDQFAREASVGARSRAAIEPSILGGYRDEEGVQRTLQTSTLLGLFDQPIEEMTALIGLSSFDRARLLQDFQDAPEDFDTTVGIGFKGGRYADLQLDTTRSATDVGDRRVDRSMPDRMMGQGGMPEFRRILEQVATRFEAMRPGVTPAETSERLLSLDAEMERLRNRISGRATDAATEIDERRETEIDPRDRIGIGGERDQTGPTRPDATGRGGSGAPADEETDEETDEESGPRRSIESYAPILRHGQRIDRLTSADDQTRFNELLLAAEQALGEGRYFWAEQRFTRALRFIPGHPMATAGLAHTQIGAGLYLSASLTLRSLFEFQPEMIDATYAPSLVPNRPRLLLALQTLEQRVAEQRDTASSAFLLAYVGRLLGDREVIERGLDAMIKAAPDDELGRLLHVLWLAHADAVEAPKASETAVAEPARD